MREPSAKETKTHEAPAELFVSMLKPGDLVWAKWHTQEEPVWMKYLGSVGVIIDEPQRSLDVAIDDPFPASLVHLALLPPAKDERHAVTIGVPAHVTLHAMRRKAAAAE